MWIGFPSHADLWEDDLAPAQAEVAAFAAALNADGAGEAIWLVAADEAAAAEARRLCPFATVIVEPFGDIWLRDTGPIIVGSGAALVADGLVEVHVHVLETLAALGGRLIRVRPTVAPGERDVVGERGQQ